MSAADAIPIDSDDESDIEDDGSKRPQALVDLYDIISKLEAPGTYACGGALPSIYPGKLSYYIANYYWRLSVLDRN